MTVTGKGSTSKGSSVLRWGRAKVVEVFGADLPSLAIFRIALAALVLADRATDLTAHYNTKASCRTPLFWNW